MTWENAIEEFMLYMQGHGRKLSTLRRYRYDLVLFTQWLVKHDRNNSEQFTKEVSNADIQDYLDAAKVERGCSASSLRQIHCKVVNFLQYHGVDIEDPYLGSSQLLKLENFATDQEIEKLFESMLSYDGLTAYQATGRKFILQRNYFLARLMLCYGFSIHDLTTLSMRDVNFAKGILMPGSTAGIKRAILLSDQDKQMLFKVYKDIPESVRPRQHTRDPFFVTFDFGRQTFRWDYSKDSPQPLTKIAIQRMLQKETKRAGVHHISPTSLRNRYILDSLRSGVPAMEIKVLLGLKTIEAIHRYIVFWRSHRLCNQFENIYKPLHTM